MTDFAAPRVERVLEPLRAELTSYCHRMLGSRFEAEDAVQETMVRAWRAFDRFEGRATIRTWLYRIATNVCLDVFQSRKRGPLPMDLGSTSSGDAAGGPRLPEDRWLQPLPGNGRAVPPIDDPAEVAVHREAIQDAFVAVLQYLPPRQRAVLILREVLEWKASEVAELLHTSVAAVNSTLQRARAAFAAADPTAQERLHLEDNAQQERLARYIDAFETVDMESLVSLLHEEATMSMSPG